MSGVCRINMDVAGGLIVGMNQSGTVFANGSPISVNADAVLPHGNGAHAGPVMIASSSKVFVNGIAVCKEGDLATCGHPATGSGNVFVD